MSEFERAIEAVRAAGDDDAAFAGVGGTRARLQRGLDARAKRAGVVSAILAALGIASGGGLAWAVTAGPWREEAEAAPVVGQAMHARERMAEAPERVPMRESAPAVAAPEPEPEAETETGTEPTTTTPTTTTAAASARHRAKVEAAYRKAHELHFHGGDAAKALAAWDEYLKAAPSGRFASEARYNRAIDLIELGRMAEARRALQPFARGEVEPAGYHQDDAAKLLARIGAGQ
jgi:hypothetical protein